MKGLEWNDPLRIRSLEELVSYVEEIGFLPLFANEIEGFSAQEHVSYLYWWTDNKEQDPWLWRAQIAAGGQLAYGKFFNKKAGFISKKWLPVFANYRRDGYDFDSLFDDELAPLRWKKIMDQFDEDTELLSADLKQRAGFSKQGEKNFDGVVTELQMHLYLCTMDFRQKKRKKDDVPYGWPLSVYAMPEHVFGREHVISAYREKPELSFERMSEQIKKHFPDASEKAIKKLLG